MLIQVFNRIKEVFSKTADELSKKGLKATESQKEIIKSELKRARNLRSACQITNLGVSLALLGIVIPIFTRNNTKKRHEQDLKLARENSIDSKKQLA